MSSKTIEINPRDADAIKNRNIVISILENTKPVLNKN